MSNYTEVRQMLILAFIRRSKQNPPYPTNGDYICLSDTLEKMAESEMLSVNEGSYEIGKEGKKAILLFDEERRNIVGPLDQYKEILIDGELIDARIPMMAFMVLPISDGERLMRAAIFATYWQDILDHLLDLSNQPNSQWQKMVAGDNMYLAVEAEVDINAWKKLGKTEQEAKMTGKWLLNPSPPTQITRSKS